MSQKRRELPFPLRSMNRNVPADLETLKSAYAKLAPAEDPPPTPPIRVKRLGLTPSRRR
jgi:hypothetical protein